MSYNQPEKEKSREKIWEHVISSLTHKRNQTSIVNPEIINEFTLQALSKVKEITYDNEDITFRQLANNSDWEEFHNSIYKTRKPSELKVAFFCGPEPVQDIKHLISRGIRLENIWGFELDKKLYKSAIEDISKHQLSINLFQGNLNDFVKVNPQQFDIVYLDFTNSLISESNNPLILINSIFESSFISDLTTVVINTCYPDKNDKNIDFLKRYFQHRKWIHRDFYNSTQGDKFHESFDVHGYYENEKMTEIITEKFKESYSEFSTSVIDLFSNVISPLQRIIKLPTLHKRFFDLEKFEKAVKKFEKTDFMSYDEDDEGGYDLMMSADNYSYWHFIQNIISEGKTLSHFFKTKIKNEKYSPFELVKFYSILHSIEEGYYDAFSKEILDTVISIQANTIEKQSGATGLFCDIPMTHLWYSLLIGKYGYPCHINFNNHKRFSYTAKTREMCLDLFTIDKCRSLYDYIPSFEFIPNMFLDIHKQLIIRCYIDKIYKTQFYYNNSFYSWGHMLCYNETENAVITETEDRTEIKI